MLGTELSGWDPSRLAASPRPTFCTNQIQVSESGDGVTLLGTLRCTTRNLHRVVTKQPEMQKQDVSTHLLIVSLPPALTEDTLTHGWK